VGLQQRRLRRPKAAYAASGPQHGRVEESGVGQGLSRRRLGGDPRRGLNQRRKATTRPNVFLTWARKRPSLLPCSARRHYLNSPACGTPSIAHNDRPRRNAVDVCKLDRRHAHRGSASTSRRSLAGIDETATSLVVIAVVEMIAGDQAGWRTQKLSPSRGTTRVVSGRLLSVGTRWSEWNGRYRDDVRPSGAAAGFGRPALGTRICGSSDLYEHSGRPAKHDQLRHLPRRFTLADLVRLQTKHNAAKRRRQPRRLPRQLLWKLRREAQPATRPFASSAGQQQEHDGGDDAVAGRRADGSWPADEFLKTQKGNNNACCKDNEPQGGLTGRSKTRTRNVPSHQGNESRCGADAPRCAALRHCQGTVRR